MNCRELKVYHLYILPTIGLSININSMGVLVAMFDHNLPMDYIRTSKEKLQDYSPEASSFRWRCLRMGPLGWSVLTLKMSRHGLRKGHMLIISVKYQYPPYVIHQPMIGVKHRIRPHPSNPVPGTPARFHRECQVPGISWSINEPHGILRHSDR